MGPIDQLFEDFGGPTNFGKVIGVQPSTASEMKRRQSIPSDYWPALIAAASDVERTDVTYEWLVKTHADAKRKRRAA